MTEQDDAENAVTNEAIKACTHEPYRTKTNGVKCRLCGANFGLILLPRLARQPAYNLDDGEE